MRRTLRPGMWLIVFLASASMIVLRLIALDSDPYSRLSWSSGLLTDEGFYIHNARNVVLFGTARTDQFNNMLIMPALHFVQVAVFRLWGVGAVQARMISVVSSLLMLVIFFAASRRVFGLRIACFATLFLGLDHITLLYNRMALMDTPGALLLVCAFYCWGVGMEKGTSTARVWLLLCGLFLGVAYCTRGLGILILPVPFLVLLWRHRVRLRVQQPLPPQEQQSVGPSAWIEMRSAEIQENIRRGKWIAAGLALVLGIYLLTWYLPHRLEIAYVNSFYLWRQLLPHSLRKLILNLLNGFFGDDRGMAPFLMRHSPAQAVLTISWFIVLYKGLLKRNQTILPQDRLQGAGAVYVTLWLLISVLFLITVSYSPSRYYVLFTPALALTASFTVTNALETWQGVLRSPCALPLVGGYCAYHFALVTFHHAHINSIVLVAASALSGCLIMYCVRTALIQRHISWETWNFVFPAVAITLWAVVNTVYIADWLGNLKYEQRDADQWLASHLPSDTVLLGDVAPGLCMNNHFRVVNVIAGLCNDHGPVKMYQGQRRAIIILDGRLIEGGWVRYYPDIIRPERRLKLFPHIVRFPVGVYRVDERDL